MAKKIDNTLLIAGGLVAAAVLYNIMTKEKEPDPQMIDCGMELTTYTGVMNVGEQIDLYKGSEPCMRLIEQYVANNQAAEYSKAVAAGEITQDQAAAMLTVDVETINGEIRMMQV